MLRVMQLGAGQRGWTKSFWASCARFAIAITIHPTFTPPQLQLQLQLSRGKPKTRSHMSCIHSCCLCCCIASLFVDVVVVVVVTALFSLTKVQLGSSLFVTPLPCLKNQAYMYFCISDPIFFEPFSFRWL